MPLIRLQKLISKYGVTSRRKAEVLIQDGRVCVNGVLVTEPGTKVPEDALITIDSRIINRYIPRIYIMMNKPSGYICSKGSKDGKPLIYDLVDNKYAGLGLYSIGRLDFMSEGLLLLTNDGDFAHIISHPSGGIVKKYMVRTDRNIPYNLIDGWKNGVYINGERYAIRDYEKISPRKVCIRLSEGKNREIRKLFECIGLNVLQLKRIAVGSLELGSLDLGQCRELTQEEVNDLLKRAAKQ